MGRIEMGKKIALAAVLMGVLGSPFTVSSARPAPIWGSCLHGPTEQSQQRTRREQALKTAQAINRAETTGPAVIPGQPRSFRPIEDLPNVPPPPAGFRLRFYADGPTYAFSLKDRTDPCEFAIFSDQDRAIYEAMPRTDVEVRPAETR
jgi:hypothetical protein